jgi:hypothetical protein
MCRGAGVVEEEASPVKHAGRGTHGRHDCKNEVTINGIKSFGDVDEDHGASGIVEGQHVGDEGGEMDVVANQSAGEICRLFQTDCWGHGGAEPGSEDLGE